MTPLSHEELHRRALERRWAGTEERLQAGTELAVLGEEVASYDVLVEAAASVLARHVAGGCVIALLSDDGGALHPLGVHGPSDEATEALEELTGLTFQPLGISHAVMQAGKGRIVEMAPEMFAERPGVARYMEITGHHHAVVVPLRAHKQSIGVIWLASARVFDQEDLNFLALCGSRLGLAVQHLRLIEGDVRGTRPEGDGPLSQLTAREREILGLVAAGLTSREAAERLVVSVRTVEWHRARVQAKLGVSGRSELTRIAREAGLDIPVR